MKKISLENVQSLSRREMRSISGGSGSASYNCTCGTNATIYNVRTCTCADICADRCPK